MRWSALVFALVSIAGCAAQDGGSADEPIPDPDVPVAETAAGADVEPTTPVLAAVASAEAAWNTLGPEHYLVRLVDDAAAIVGHPCVWITEVHGETKDLRVTSFFDTDCERRDVSVPALHQLIRDLEAAVAGGEGSLDVDWLDPGVPVRIRFTPDVGDTQSLEIDFHDLDAVTSVRSDLANARSAWASAGIVAYRLEVVEQVNHWARGCRWTTEVRDGRVVDRSLDAGNNSYCREIDWTIEMIFDQVSGWLDTTDEFSDPSFGEHTVVAVFDERGVPTALEFDMANGYDEESTMEITFTELGG